MKRGQEIDSKQGIGGYVFDELSGSFAFPRPWMEGEPPSVLDLKPTKELENDVNKRCIFARVQLVDAPDEIALAAGEETRGEFEL